MIHFKYFASAIRGLCDTNDAQPDTTVSFFCQVELGVGELSYHQQFEQDMDLSRFLTSETLNTAEDDDDSHVADFYLYMPCSEAESV